MPNLKLHAIKTMPHKDYLVNFHPHHNLLLVYLPFGWLFFLLVLKYEKGQWVHCQIKLFNSKSLSCIQLFMTPWTVAHQAPLSMGFSKQEYWSGLPFPSSGYLSDPGVEPRSPALQADSLPSETPGKPKNTGVGSLSPVQGIFLTQKSNPGSPTSQANSFYHLRHQVLPTADHLRGPERPQQT